MTGCCSAVWLFPGMTAVTVLLLVFGAVIYRLARWLEAKEIPGES